MKFAIITHVPHGMQKDTYFAYGPYVREMNIWGNFVDEMIIVAPLSLIRKTDIDLEYTASVIEFLKVPGFNFKSATAIIKSVFSLPAILFSVFMAMKKADHVHLRCPGNMGLIGCLVQIFFPRKQKTAKYAGNWDPKAAQPWSYKLQRWILGNTFLTRNMQVLVYGNWPGSSRNIRPFFTATYKESDKTPVLPRTLHGDLKFLFVGTLSPGKRPLHAVKLVEKLFQSGYPVALDVYGEGNQRATLENYITTQGLSDVVRLLGNNTEATVRKAYQESHFLLLPSQSEGWPKVVAEAMFWGCFPIASSVSCVPSMVDFGNRGILLEMEIDKDAEKIIAAINHPEAYEAKVVHAMEWSRKYTIDLFSNEIKALLKS